MQAFFDFLFWCYRQTLSVSESIVWMGLRSDAACPQQSSECSLGRAGTPGAPLRQLPSCARLGRTNASVPTRSLIARLQNREHIERLGQVRVSGERVPRLAFDQDVHTLDSRNVDGQRLHQRVYGELLVENAGAVLVGERGIQIDDGRARIDQIDAA